MNDELIKVQLELQKKQKQLKRYGKVLQAKKHVRETLRRQNLVCKVEHLPAGDDSQLVIAKVSNKSTKCVTFRDVPLHCDQHFSQNKVVSVGEQDISISEPKYLSFVETENESGDQICIHSNRLDGKMNNATIMLHDVANCKVNDEPICLSQMIHLNKDVIEIATEPATTLELDGDLNMRLELESRNALHFDSQYISCKNEYCLQNQCEESLGCRCPTCSHSNEIDLSHQEPIQVDCIDQEVTVLKHSPPLNESLGNSFLSLKEEMTECCSSINNLSICNNNNVVNAKLETNGAEICTEQQPVLMEELQSFSGGKTERGLPSSNQLDEEQMTIKPELPSHHDDFSSSFLGTSMVNNHPLPITNQFGLIICSVIAPELCNDLVRLALIQENGVSIWQYNQRRSDSCGEEKMQQRQWFLLSQKEMDIFQSLTMGSIVATSLFVLSEAFRLFVVIKRNFDLELVYLQCNSEMNWTLVSTLMSSHSGANLLLCAIDDWSIAFSSTLSSSDLTAEKCLLYCVHFDISFSKRHNRWSLELDPRLQKPFWSAPLSQLVKLNCSDHNSLIFVCDQKHVNLFSAGDGVLLQSFPRGDTLSISSCILWAAVIQDLMFMLRIVSTGREDCKLVITVVNPITGLTDDWSEIPFPNSSKCLHQDKFCGGIVSSLLMKKRFIFVLENQLVELVLQELSL